MDSDHDWTTTGLFSPSKAKAHQAQAKEWAQVDAWLAKRSSSKRLPEFERNEDTLQALLGLATANDSADEQRSSIDRVEKAAASSLLRRIETSSEGMHELLMEHLETNADLDGLAQMSVLLGAPSPSALHVGMSIVDLKDAHFTSQQQVDRVEAQLQALKAEQQRVREILASLSHEDLQPGSDVPDQIAEWTRSTKHLRAKVGEYDDRLAGVPSDRKSVISFESIARQTADLSEQNHQLERLESELGAFQSLPSDAKGARGTLEGARESLRKLTRQRDALFEKMAAA